MIIEALIAAGVVIGGLAVVAFWNEIVNWFKALVSKIKQVIEEIKTKIKKFLYAMGAFIEDLQNGMVEFKHKLYTKENGEYYEETTKKRIEKKELPAKIRAKLEAQEEEIDVTEELEEECELELNS